MLPLFNLAVLISSGVLACLWVLHYTEHIELVGGFLGLSGAFAWIAFVTNIVPDTHKQTLQKLFDDWVLRTRFSWLVVLGVFGIFAWLGPLSSGTIVLDSTLDGAYRVVQVRAAANATAAGEPEVEKALPPRGKLKIPVSTGPFGRAKVRVKLTALPSRYVEVSFLGRTSLNVPDSLRQRPLLLVHLSPEDSGVLSKTPATLFVCESAASCGASRHLAMVPEFRGESLWLGADPDVAVPLLIQERWRAEITRDRADPVRVLARWLPPRSLLDDRQLERGQAITLRLCWDLSGKLLRLGDRTLDVAGVEGGRNHVQVHRYPDLVFDPEELENRPCHG